MNTRTDIRPSQRVGAMRPKTVFSPNRALFWLLLHAPLGYAMHQSSTIATAHAGIVLLSGLILAVSTKSALSIASMAAYITGAEVMWRMCKAHIPWETGKYAVILILLLFGFRASYKRARWTILYILLLIPAVIPPFTELPFNLARMYVSFNLSGPISLAVCIWFFSSQSFNRSDLNRILLFLIMPITGIACITVISTYYNDITFRTASNFTASGGFGPNQVASMFALGFTAMFFLLLFSATNKKYYRLISMAVMGVFFVQSVMTFSRTGPYLAIGSVAAGSMFFLNNFRARLGIAFGIIAFLFVGHFYLFPTLNGFTSGMLKARYQELNTSNRTIILEEELEVWSEKPILGVGLGMVRFYRNDFTHAASHTEFSRLLAEHGAMGLLALLLLMIKMSENIFSKRNEFERSFTASLSCYFVGFLLVSGMRLVAPGLALGLAFATLLTDEESNGSTN